MYKTPPAHCGGHFRESTIFPGYPYPRKEREKDRGAGAQLAAFGWQWNQFYCQTCLLLNLTKSAGNVVVCRQQQKNIEQRRSEPH